MNDEIKEKLISLREDSYADFSRKLIPGAENVLGIRMPALRSYAKALASETGAKALEGGDDYYYEEIMLRGLIIGYLKLDNQSLYKEIECFVPKITNWAVCDTFCSNLKRVKKDRGFFWPLVEMYAASQKEFEQRFAAVMILDHYVCEEYIARSLCLLLSIDTSAYYSSMAVAWALSECFIKFPEVTDAVLTPERVDMPTLRRAVRKICDSYRVSEENKIRLKERIV